MKKVLASITLLATLASCGKGVAPLGDLHDAADTYTQVNAESRNSLPADVIVDDYVSESIPSFGGMYFDAATQSYVVLLKDSINSQSLEYANLLETVLSAYNLRDDSTNVLSQQSSPNIRVENVKYSLLDLKNAQNKIISSEIMKSIQGVSIDVRSNSIEIVLIDEKDKSKIKSALKNLRIEDNIFKTRGPIKLYVMANAASYVRPAFAGLGISKASSDQICSTGPTVRRLTTTASGTTTTYGFLTAAHCTDYIGEGFTQGGENLASTAAISRTTDGYYEADVAFLASAQSQVRGSTKPDYVEGYQSLAIYNTTSGYFRTQAAPVQGTVLVSYGRRGKVSGPIIYGPFTGNAYNFYTGAAVPIKNVYCFETPSLYPTDPNSFGGQSGGIILDQQTRVAGITSSAGELPYASGRVAKIVCFSPISNALNALNENGVSYTLY